MTLIDRDIIIEEMLKETQKLKANTNAMTNCCSNITNGMIKWLQAYPVIEEVAPIIHAQWIWKEFYGEPGVMLCCSNCLETEGANVSFEYCPHCGAHMDGGSR